MALTNAEVTITITPDYGMGPYAWEKPASDQTPYVGVCIATAVDPFLTEDGTTINEALHAAFVAWTEDFEQFAEQPAFDWKAFHTRGTSLSHRLRLELGERFRVVYCKPFEDPAHAVDAEVEIVVSAQPSA